MRPTPQELIDGVRALLKDVIAPELTSEHAQHRLAEIRSVLAQVEWNDAGLDLRRSVADRQALLRDLLTWWDSDVAVGQHFSAVRPQVQGAAQALPAVEFAALGVQDDLVAAALVALVDPLSNWWRQHPDEPTGAAAYGRLVQLA